MSNPWHRLYTPTVEPQLTADESVMSTFLARRDATPDAVAVVDPFGSLTYAELDRRSSCMARWLIEHELLVGDRMAIMLQNCSEFVIGLLAAWRAQAIAVPVSPMLRAAELTHVLVDSGAKFVICEPDTYTMFAVLAIAETITPIVVDERDQAPDEIARFVDVAAGDDWRFPVMAASETAAIVYTSGTTGPPKGVIVSHASLAHSAMVYRQWFDIGSHDPVLGGAPLSHITGLVAGVALSWVAGASLVLLGRFTARGFVEAVDRHRCTNAVLAVTAYRSVLESLRPDDGTKLATMTRCFSGGAPVFPQDCERWEAATGSRLYGVYGMTETTSPTHAVPLGRSAPIEGSGALSVGVPVPGLQFRIVDPSSGQEVGPGALGELQVAGPMVTSGYWKNPEATSAQFIDGYLRTGDLARADPEGWLFVVDRLKDIINAAGYKVSPSEVEAVLLTHPTVADAAVVGVPDTYRGETVAALVVAHAKEEIDPAALIAYCKSRMAAYKYPRIVHEVPDLPTTSNGKVRRNELRALASKMTPSG